MAKVRCDKWKQCKWGHCEHYREHEPTNVCEADCPDVGHVKCEECK